MIRRFAPSNWLTALMLFAALALAPAVARAGELVDRAALDALFVELKAAPDAAVAHVIDQRIWQIWMSPTDPVLAERMSEVMAARSVLNLPEAVKMLDALVADYPEYAEGWNQRATIHYMMGNYEASLTDIDKVLEFEPRHFGALSGRALIHLDQGKRALAIKDISQALDVHPFLNERQLFPELQRDITRI